jgi:hypothetical protein
MTLIFFFAFSLLRLQTAERANICIPRTKKKRRKDVHVLFAFGADENVDYASDGIYQVPVSS